MFLDYTKYLSQNYSWVHFVVDRHSNVQKQMSATLLSMLEFQRKPRTPWGRDGGHHHHRPLLGRSLD